MACLLSMLHYTSANLLEPRSSCHPGQSFHQAHCDREWGASGSSPAMPTAIVNWQLQLAVEVRQCPLPSRAGKGGRGREGKAEGEGRATSDKV